MKDIIEVPTGRVIQVKDKEFESLRKNGLIFYASKYQGIEINNYIFYQYYEQDIYNFLDRIM